MNKGNTKQQSSLSYIASITQGMAAWYVRWSMESLQIQMRGLPCEVRSQLKVATIMSR